MTRFLTRENIKLVVVAVAVLLVAWTAPSVAHGVHAQFAHNADKVDGKHAVSAGTSKANAKKKLVAHNKKGELPAKFIPKSFVTEGEYGNRPGTRLIAGGLVNAAGVPDGGNNHFHMGVWSVQKTGVGAYTLRYRAPGLCAGPQWPIIYLTRAFSSGEVYNSNSFRDCTTNVYTTFVVTSNSAGAAADGAFFFAVHGPGKTVGPAPTPRATGRTGGDSATD
jgi:hypothetical protein